MKRRDYNGKCFPAQVGCYLDEKEKLFCQAVFILGYPATKAYRLIISPGVAVSSASSLGCRLLQEPRIQKYIRTLDMLQYSFKVNLGALKYQ